MDIVFVTEYRIDTVALNICVVVTFDDIVDDVLRAAVARVPNFTYSILLTASPMKNIYSFRDFPIVEAGCIMARK